MRPMRALPAVLLVPALLVASAAGGALWAWLPAFLKVRRGVGEVITTLLLNWVGIHFAGWVVHGPLQESRGVFPFTDLIHEAARLPVLVPGTRVQVVGYKTASADVTGRVVDYRLPPQRATLRSGPALPLVITAVQHLHR